MAIVRSRRLGQYEIRSAIVAGGMGEVSKARDTHLDHTVPISPIDRRVSKKFRYEEIDYEIYSAHCSRGATREREQSCANLADRYECSFLTRDVGSNARAVGASLRVERSSSTLEGWRYRLHAGPGQRVHSES